MLETSARLLKLLSLLQVRRDWTGPELADRLSVDVRTIRRDVEKLRNLGYPVTSLPGATGGYQLGAGAELPPLLLDDDEAVAVAVGLRTAANGTIAGIEETSVRALTKLEQVLPARLRRRVQALQHHTTPLAPTGPTVDPETLTVIAAACRDHQQLRFPYASTRGEPAKRLVEPQGLVHTGRRWYLVAWDVSKKDWRTFRVDRITAEPVLAARFTPREPPAESLGEFVSRQVSSNVYTHQALLTIHAPLEQVAERTTPISAMLEPIDATSCRMRTGADSLDRILWHLMFLGFDFTVHEPEELAEHVATLITRLQNSIGARR
ncbi:Predicted DNA-binding transcriptional regulator YafY, contains an HTH and WYL domains [Lentzea fradiae]|uniref:Predicted DNA-binding transcriptional regulator YafY, contains an HTH and WYL domains n=1 Tax=Lentzea fradiae TaxID=200378 RepID=A0A1G8AF55_9PSEU|nr:YafY family protein [Lentzea fradiae]SDH19476.1 Predicted DNA-binding transcriptional regulator YafY, contains an HTH and WYL domains [Lentzea fradiae]